MVNSKLYKSKKINFVLWLIILLIVLFNHIHQCIEINYYLLRYLVDFQDEVQQKQLASQISTDIDRQPNNISLNRVAGIVFLNLSENESALEHLLYAKTVEPNDKLVLYWLGLAYERMGDYENVLLVMYQYGDQEYFPNPIDNLSEKEILNLAEKVLRKPISAQAHMKIAERVYSASSELALQHFEEALQEDSDEELVFLTPAWFYYDLGDFETARIFGTRAMLQFPQSPWVHLFNGTLNRRIGDLERAASSYSMAIELSTDKQSSKDTAQIALTGVYNQQGEYQRALDQLAILNSRHSQSQKQMFYLERAWANAGINICQDALADLETANSLIVLDSDNKLFQKYQNRIIGLCP